jgi:hypothetical protein
MDELVLVLAFQSAELLHDPPPRGQYSKRKNLTIVIFATLETFFSTRHGTDFEHSMCTLLGRVNSPAPPYPNPDIQERIYNQAILRTIMHFPQNCHARLVRDCIVVSYATNMLNDLFRAASIIVSQGRRRSRRGFHQ